MDELKEVLSSLSSLSLAACGSNVVSLASDLNGGKVYYYIIDINGAY